MVTNLATQEKDEKKCGQKHRTNEFLNGQGQRTNKMEILVNG